MCALVTHNFVLLIVFIVLLMHFIMQVVKLDII